MSFAVNLRRPLPCGCGSRKATDPGDGQWRCEKCGTVVEIPHGSFGVLQQARGAR